MRIPTRLLKLALLLAPAQPATLHAQAYDANAHVAAADTPVTVRWNRLVPKLDEENTARRRAARRAATAAGDSAALRRLAQNPAPFLFRVYTLLSVSQYAAVNSARETPDASSDAAIATASAAALNEVYTDSAVRATIARELTRDLDRSRIGSRGAERTRAGERLGEDAARKAIASAPPALSLVGPWNGTIPKGPGMWYSAQGVPPIGIGMTRARTWLLDSASQLRSAPPPAYGSPEWQAALAEVKRVGRERTPEQTRLAQLWNSADPWARWNETASAAIIRHRLPDADAARVLAVLNAAASDAIVACFDAKYYYWTIRPSQADSTIVLADSVQLPNFPSYPSGHACSAGAFDATLGHFFPQDRAEFTRIAEEQAMSRLYGGIHYRFDNDEGLALGRRVALYVVQQERRGKLRGSR